MDNELNNKEIENDTGDVSDDFIPKNALPICPNCFEPCDPALNYYCDKCDSNEVMNPMASYVPFVNIRFWTGIYGKLWNNIWNKDDNKSIISKAFSVFVIILGAPILLIVGLPLKLIGKIKKTQKQRVVTVIFYVVLSLLALTYVLWGVMYQ